jgi:outer membrane protein assembly factor BamE (lipoprotein component of BamABCDE complex)
MIARIAIFLLLMVSLATAGCAGSGGSAEKAQGASPAKAGTMAAPPAGSAMAKVTVGMTDAQVRKEMGDPDNTTAYMTGKAWIPFYYGPDTHRADWIYNGKGRVVFSRNRYSGGLKVIDVRYDPNEGS